MRTLLYLHIRGVSVARYQLCCGSFVSSPRHDQNSDASGARSHAAGATLARGVAARFAAPRAGAGPRNAHLRGARVAFRPSCSRRRGAAAAVSSPTAGREVRRAPRPRRASAPRCLVRVSWSTKVSPTLLPLTRAAARKPRLTCTRSRCGSDAWCVAVTLRWSPQPKLVAPCSLLTLPPLLLLQGHARLRRVACV